MPSQTPIEATRARWHKSLPNKRDINDIEQIVYSLGSKRDGLVAVFSRNIYDKAQSKPEIWTWIPVTYSLHFSRTHYRIRLYLACIPHPGTNRDAHDAVKQYLAYTDRVMEAFLTDAIDANAAKQMSESWSSPEFNAFLTIESFVNVHLPERIDDYMKKNNTDLIEDCEFSQKHWQEYTNTMDGILLGDCFNWDTRTLKDRGKIEEISDFVHDWAIGEEVDSARYVSNIRGT